MEHPNDAGCRGLVAAMILQGFKDLRMMTSADGHSPETVRDMAWAWMHEKVTYARDPSSHKNPKKQRLRAYRTQDVGGFEWCCCMLDLDPEYYRHLSMSREGINSILGRHGSNQHHAK